MGGCTRGTSHGVARSLLVSGVLAVSLNVLPARASSELGSESAGERWLQAEEDIVCNDKARWSQMPWDFLSFAERDSWTRLGWTPDQWDAAHPIPTTTAKTSTSTFGRRLEEDDFVEDEVEEGTEPGDWRLRGRERRVQATPVVRTTTQTRTTTSTTAIPMTEYMCYQDLLEDQQDAVRTVGYTISTWRACKRPGCPWPPGIPTPNATCLDILDWTQRLLGMTWVDLTSSKRDALVMLGWDPVGTRWNVQDFPESYASLWNGLQQRQQEAAAFLGFNPQVWEKCESASPCIIRKERLEKHWSTIQWTSMKPPFQLRMRQLGYDEERWTNGEAPTIYKDYDELTPGQEVAVRLAGFVKDIWDDCPDTICEDRFEYVVRKYKGVAWDDMATAQKRAWMLLEFTPQLWAEGGMDNTPAKQKRWTELSLDQQIQAAFLGHSEGSWQGCDLGWKSPVMNETGPASQISTSPIRTVRGRMVIRRPFQEVSGNVYGAAVAKLPSSFMAIFERAVARALFCVNPPLSEDPSTYIANDGTPLCIKKDIFEMQKKRVKVLAVVEGSIIVDFFLASNATAKELPSPELFASLKRMVESETSPLCQDMEFGKYATVASVEEVPLSHLSEAEMATALQFEQTRDKYGPGTACVLQSDARLGVVKCPTAGAFRQASSVGMLLASLVVFAGIVEL